MKGFADIDKKVAGVDTRMASTQGDANDPVTTLEVDLNTRMASMERDLILLQRMAGVAIVLTAAIVLRVFTH